LKCIDEGGVIQLENKVAILSIVVLIIIATNLLVWASQQEGVVTAKENGFSEGYLAGKNFGLKEGNQIGYQNGVIDGRVEGIIFGNRTGFALGNSTGYLQKVSEITGIPGIAYMKRYPTYQEILDFIAQDIVHNNQYSSNYTCFGFANDFANEAYNQGYCCGIVYVSLDYGSTQHTLNCFWAIDFGMVFVEPQTDTIVSLDVGQVYKPAGLESLGIVYGYNIVW
jgi:hypothetical protein